VVGDLGYLVVDQEWLLLVFPFVQHSAEAQELVWDLGYLGYQGYLGYLLAN